MWFGAGCGDYRRRRNCKGLPSWQQSHQQGSETSVILNQFMYCTVLQMCELRSMQMAFSFFISVMQEKCPEETEKMQFRILDSVP